MERLEAIDTAELERQLEDVEAKESVQLLMAAIAHKHGIEIATLADWYGLSVDAIESGFDELESQPLADAIDVIERYNQESPAPFVPPTDAQVAYLDYEVLDDYGWAVEDDDLFEKAADADLEGSAYGRIAVEAGQTILEAAEDRGFTWPYACRGGACANCVAILKAGEIAMPGDHILTDEMTEEMDARLTCVGVPVTDEVEIVYNAKHLEPLERFHLPPQRFEATE